MSDLKIYCNHTLTDFPLIPVFASMGCIKGMQISESDHWIVGNRSEEET